MDLPSPGEEQQFVEPFTPRETDILALLAEGMSDREIADCLVVATSTVKWYNRQIYDKLGVSGREQAVERATALGLLGDGEEAGPIFLENPYKGLRAFGEADAPDFFGRDTLVARLAARLAEPVEFGRFLAVVGPSGSGKSSVVKAGLVPALRLGKLPGSENWQIVTIMPGAQPWEELEAALLRIAVNPPETLLTQLREDERGLLRAVKRVLPGDKDKTLLLVIDQFEEVFTLVPEPAEARFLLDSLYAAVTDPRAPVRVVITLRADFYDKPLMVPDFSEMVRLRTEAITPLTAEELERAITGPTERVGAQLETGLVSALVSEVSEQPGPLPMLQYALTELFDQRQGRTLTLATYDKMGGALGALARRADAVFGNLRPQEQTAARQVMLRLVTLGEGTEDIRRRASLAELLSVGAEASQPTLDAFDWSRLLTFDLDPTTGEAIVDLAHEAIIREWGRLRTWLDESRDDVRLQRMLARSAAEWADADREASYLLHGSRLAQFEGWAQMTDVALTEEERFYLKSSIEGEQRRQARRRLIRNATLTITAVVAVIMTVLTLIAFDREGQAQQNAAVAEVRLYEAWDTQALFLADLSQQELVAGSRQNALLLALESLVHYPEGVFHAESHQALLDVLTNPAQELVHLRPGGAVRGAAWDTDHRRVLTWSNDGTTRVWDAASGEELLILRHAGAVREAMWNASGTRVLSWSGGRGGDNTARLWDAASGETLLLLRHADGVQGVTWFEDPVSGMGRILSWTSHVLHVWDAVSGDELHQLTHDDDIVEARMNSGGTAILSWTEGGLVRFWDVANGEALLILAHDETVQGARLSRDETAILSWSSDDTVRVWSVLDGQELLRLQHARSVLGATWNSDETRILTWAFDDTIRTWDAFSGEGYHILRHEGDVLGATWIEDENVREVRILSWSRDGTVCVWNAASGEILLTLRHDRGVQGATWIEDEVTGEARILSWSLDGTVRLWDGASGAALLMLRHEDDVLGALVAEDGNRILSWSRDGTVRVWDTRREGALQTIPHAGVTNVAWNNDETAILSWSRAATGPDRFFQIWDTVREETRFSLRHETLGIAWSRDGTQIAAWTPGSRSWEAGVSPPANIRIWDASNGDELLRLNHEGDFINGILWNGDGSRLLSLGGYELRVWDTVSGDLLLTLPYQTEGAIWNRDETRILSWGPTEGYGSSLVVWDTTSGEELFTFIYRDRRGGLNAEGVRGGVVRVGSWNSDETRILAWSFSQLMRGSVGYVWVLDAETGQELLILQHDHSFVAGAIWNNADTRILSWSQDDTVRVWDAQAGQELLTLQHDRDVAGAAWNNDETRILSWADNSLHVWDAESGQLLFTLRHDDTIGNAVWSRDGSQILTWSEDSTVRLWNAANGTLMLILPHEYPLLGATWSQDETCVLSWWRSTDGTAGAVHVWTLDIEELVALGRSQVIREFSNEELHHYFLPTLEPTLIPSPTP